MVWRQSAKLERKVRTVSGQNMVLEEELEKVNKQSARLELGNSKRRSEIATKAVPPSR